MKQIANTLHRSLNDLLEQMRHGEVHILASSLSFATLISIVPLLAVSLSVFHAFGGLESLLKMVEPFILQNLAPGAGTDVAQAIRNAIERVHSGALGLTGVLSLLVISTKMFFDIEMAVQKVWQVKIRRSMTLRLCIYWFILFLIPVAMAVAIGALGSHNLNILGHLPRGTLSFIFSFIGLFGIYKWMPPCKVEIRWAAFSSLMAAITISIFQNFYAILVKKIFSYNKLYGGLASIPIFLFWILLVWWVCLIGVALNASLQKQFTVAK